MVKGWYGQTLVFPLAGGPCPDDDAQAQDDRLEAMAAAHPEVDWLGRRSGVYSAYVNLERGGYQAGGRTLCELLDKLAEFFEGTESAGPDTG